LIQERLLQRPEKVNQDSLAGKRKELKRPKAKVAVVLSGRWPYDEALEHLCAWTREAAEVGAEYICFPEYYFDQDREDDSSLSRGRGYSGRQTGLQTGEYQALGR